MLLLGRREESITVVESAVEEVARTHRSFKPCHHPCLPP